LNPHVTLFILLELTHDPVMGRAFSLGYIGHEVLQRLDDIHDSKAIIITIAMRMPHRIAVIRIPT
jgi:hypothetical protein